MYRDGLSRGPKLLFSSGLWWSRGVESREFFRSELIPGFSERKRVSERRHPRCAEEEFSGYRRENVEWRSNAWRHIGCNYCCSVSEGKQGLLCKDGDSWAILCENGSVFELSHDHKPTNPKEYPRIVKAGGRVVYKRVTCGNKYLAISRGLGDFEFKRNRVLNLEDQIVTADPEIIYKEIGEDDEFIVLASDGIWDCMTNEQVLEILRMRLVKGILPHIICENIMKDCMAPNSSLIL